MPSSYLSLTKSASQTISAANTLVTFQTIGAQSNWSFSSGSSIIVPSGITKVQATLQVVTTAAAFADGLVRMLKNGAVVLEQYTDDQYWFPINMQAVLSVTSGDTISFDATSFGASQSLSTLTRATFKGWL